MASNLIYHYVYRITNVVEGIHYYGKRTCKVDPVNDLGITYFSSSSDTEFIRTQKEHPERFKYKVIRIFQESNSALLFEVRLHDRFDVGNNTAFYNKSKQTTSKWTTSGMTVGESTRRKVSNAMKNRLMTEEHRKNLSKSAKGRIKSASHCKNISIAQSGMIWIRNILTGGNRRHDKNQSLPDGWEIGRTKGACSGLKWIHDPVTGNKSMTPKNDPLPIGWEIGRGSKNTWKFRQPA